MGKPTFDARVQRSEIRDQISEALTFRHLTSDIWHLISGIKRRYEISESIGGFKRTQGTETSQYLEERTSTETPLVVASERGSGQWRMRDNRNRLESRAAAGDSPVRVTRAFVLE